MTDAYAAAETGLDTSTPIELYRFSGAYGSYTFTSGNRQMTFNAPGGGALETYMPIPIQRTEIVLGDVTEKNELRVTMPLADNQLVFDYVFNIAPTDQLQLVIYRQQGVAGPYLAIFNGEVAGISVKEKKVVLTIPSIFTNYLQTEYPNIYYQSSCNHSLFDSGCGLDRAKFLVTATVESVDPTNTIFTFNLVGDPPPGNGEAPGYEGDTATWDGVTYNYSDTEEWTQYLFDYPDIQPEANKQVNIGNFPSTVAYAAWHYQEFGKAEGRTATPTPGVDVGGGILADGWLNAGIVTDGREQRLILIHIGSTCTMNYPMRNIQVGDQITMLPGCLHTSQDCINKFNNGVNFLGFEYIPYINVFELGIGV